jgi:putative PIN family toxin of toxin-antitoxin system
MLSFFMRVVIDTNVIISSFLKADSAPRDVLRLCLKSEIKPLIGTQLFLEYQSVIGKETLFKNCPVSLTEREELFNAFLSVCEWVSVYYLWRPNLIDESDNHLIELAVAGNAEYIITGNKRDFANSELFFPRITIESPRNFINRKGL